jgi:hypothetical protein
MEFKALALITLVLAAWINGCTKTDNYSEIIRIKSKMGIEAYIVEAHFGNNESNTQVLLDFPKTGCGSGVVSSRGVGLGISIMWINDSTLQVSKPKKVILSKNYFAEIIQCYDQKVRVQIVGGTSSN